MTSTSALRQQLRTTASAISSVVSTGSTLRTPTGTRHAQRAGDERTRRAAPPRRGGERDAHLAAAVIRDESHRIDRLARRAGGDEDALSRTSGPLDARARVRRARGSFRVPACVPDRSPRPPRADPVVGFEHPVAELPQMLDVALRLRVRPHAIVHRGNEQHRSRGREETRRLRRSSAWPLAARARKSAVAGATTTASALRGELDVIERVPGGNELRVDRPSGERLERDRADELLRRAGVSTTSTSAPPASAAAPATPICSSRFLR